MRNTRLRPAIITALAWAFAGSVWFTLIYLARAQ
jgi:hypothetical protein